MISQISTDGTGWALFSDDEKMRYRLARCLKPGVRITDRRQSALPQGVGNLQFSFDGSAEVVQVQNDYDLVTHGLRRVVFLLLNPSTATAFKPDNTVTECRKRAVALGADLLEVVNMFALRTPYPADLRRAPADQRGAGAVNDIAILNACTDASMVIAAWGNHGDLDARSAWVVSMLHENNIRLHALGTTKSGVPKHPLARGVHRIPADQQPFAWPA